MAGVPDRGGAYPIASDNKSPNLGDYYLNAEGRVCCRDPSCLTDVVVFKEDTDAHDNMARAIQRAQAHWAEQNSLNVRDEKDSA